MRHYLTWILGFKVKICLELSAFGGGFLSIFAPMTVIGVVCDAETGYIIPAVFGRWRKSNKLGYNPFRDIRRNIFKHYDAQNVIRRPESVT